MEVDRIIMLHPYEHSLACPQCHERPKPIPASACGIDAWIIGCGCELGTFGMDDQQAVRRWNARVINRILKEAADKRNSKLAAFRWRVSVKHF